LITTGALNPIINKANPFVHWSGFSTGVNLPLGGHFIYPRGTFDDAVAHLSTALVSKEKTGGKFYVRKLARGKCVKKVENSWYR